MIGGDGRSVLHPAGRRRADRAVRTPRPRRAAAHRGARALLPRRLRGHRPAHPPRPHRLVLHPRGRGRIPPGRRLAPRRPRHIPVGAAEHRARLPSLRRRRPPAQLPHAERRLHRTAAGLVPSPESKRTYVRVHPNLPVLRRELERVDFGTDARPGLPPSLVDAIEADGGLWYAGDHYIDAASVVARAREVNALALRLDFRDLSLLEELPKVRYLHLLSDGRPPLGPVAGLTKLRALILGVSALRGELDLAAFPQLRWLRASLGGEGGEALRASLSRGHPRLEHLSFTEVRDRTLDELVHGFPRLRHLRVHFADHLRTLGDLGPVARMLRGLDLDFTGLRSLDGIGVLRKLDMFRLYGGKVTDIQPLAALASLRYAELDSGPGVASLAPLRGHPRLRMLALSLLQDEDLSPLTSMRELVAVGRGPRVGGAPPFPDLAALPRNHPFRAEFRRAVYG